MAFSRFRAPAWHLGLVIVLVALRASAADDWTPRRSFRTFSKANWRGLPQSSVIALAQDESGILWIGTLDGVASFDGRTITPVPAEPGAPLRGMITDLAARKGGGVYVGSPAGVYVFDGVSWRLVKTERAVAALAEALDGTLFVADGKGAVWTLRGPSSWQRRTEMTEPAVALASAPDGSIWAATETSVVRLERGRAEAAVSGPGLPGMPGAMLVARDGRVWVATLNGSVHWARRGDKEWHQAPFASWPRGAFRCLTEDRRGRIWAGSYGGGVAFGTADGPWTVWNAANGPFEAGVMSVLADREGSVWFGLNAIGLAQWVGEEWSHRTAVDPTNPGRQLFSAFGISRGAAPGSLLVALFNTGVLSLGDGAARHYGAEDGLTEDVRAVAEAEPGLLFAGTRFGLFEARRGEPFRRVLKLEGGFVMGLFRSPQGVWYAASTQGVFVREGGEWKPAAALNSALDNVHVRGMTWRKNGELWIATLRGVSVFREGAPPEKISSARVPEIPESVNAVLELDGDEIWAGGTGGIGIRRGGKWRRITEADGVPGQTVYSLARAPDGSVWAGGSGGVGHFVDGRWKVWDSRAGLLQEECNLNGLAVEDDGSVYVGAMGGLAHFDPTVAPLPPPELKLVWRSTPRRDAEGVARLAPGERALHVNWSAPWLGSRPVQYRVRVPRLRETWSAPMSDDHLDVENLAAGTWTVEVAARVEGAREWTAPLALSVAVPPYWHETLLARLGFAALLLAACVGVVRLRMRALRRHAAALEATVRERTAELAEKVHLLSDSEKRALAASRAKSAFLANMSHELRTPLNGVLGFAQLLARRPGRDAEDREGLSVILKSGEHLLGLINDVLSLSKIEAGRVTLDEAPFDLAAMVRDVADVLRLRAEAKDLKLVSSIDEAELPRAVAGDEGRLRQILINLVGNAVKFTEQGGVTLRVTWAGGRGSFDVEDTGPGIAKDELPSLFEPFVQTEAGRRSKEGTGLGLALSRDLARLMGGDISVESAPGQGSRFHLDVRLPEASAAAIAADGDRRRVVSIAPGQRSFRILVVDDLALNRTVLTRLLLSVGFEVRGAASGEEALEVWRGWEPHLIWMDKRMPGIDGLEVTRTIRAEEKARGSARVPILALSASALEHERGEILAAGCDDFVAKPFREGTIFAKLREYLGVKYVHEDRTERTAGSGAAIPAVAERTGRVAARVLLVDDDWICREVAQELIRGRGFDVTTAASGREALALLDDAAFDLVLMDLQMPEMDGVEAARRIKSRPGMARLPVIAMTADSFEGERKRLAEAGMDDYIGKPVEPAAIERVLGRWLPLRQVS